jgi:hypothetical protein
MSICLLALVVVIPGIYLIKQQLQCMGQGQKEQAIEQDIRDRLLQKGGLWDLHLEQAKPFPSYKEIFLERTQHHGKLHQSIGRLVAWPGQLVYLRRDEQGALKEADFYINSRPCVVGDDHVRVYFQPGQFTRVENGAYVYLVGTLKNPGIQSFGLEIENCSIERQYATTTK